MVVFVSYNNNVKGGGGLQPGKGRNRVFFCFWQRGVSATRCFLPDQKILILAEIREFWNPKTRFPENRQFWNFQNLLLHFLR